MALDQNGSTFGAWTDAEIAERVRFGQSKFEKIIQDLIAAKNNLNTLNNDWSLGSDIRDHFSDRPPNVGTFPQKGLWQTRAALDSDLQASFDGHFITLVTASTFTSIDSGVGRRIDQVETAFEARAKISAHGSTISPFLGFTNLATANHVSAPGSNGVWFERGTNANTWKCRSRSGGADQTTTDNQAGNYVNWDVLRIAFTVASAKFFINGTLVATHTLNLPITVGQLGFVQHSTSAGDTKVDYAHFVATENAVSP